MRIVVSCNHNIDSRLRCVGACNTGPCSLLGAQLLPAFHVEPHVLRCGAVGSGFAPIIVVIVGWVRVR